MAVFSQPVVAAEQHRMVLAGYAQLALAAPAQRLVVRSVAVMADKVAATIREEEPVGIPVMVVRAVAAAVVAAEELVYSGKALVDFQMATAVAAVAAAATAWDQAVLVAVPERLA